MLLLVILFAIKLLAQVNIFKLFGNFFSVLIDFGLILPVYKAKKVPLLQVIRSILKIVQICLP